MTDIHLDADADDQQLLAQVVNYYHATFKQNADAIDYLRKRGITNGQVIDHFRIGYADRGLGRLLPSKDSKAGRAIRGRLESLGVFRAATGHEHFSGSIVFPITAGDGTGRIADIYGRKVLGKQLRRGTPLDLHLAEGLPGV